MTDLTKSHLRLIRRKVVDEDWISHMNDSKWNELFREIQENWLPWCYRQKSILENDFGILTAPPKDWENDWWYGYHNLEIEIVDIHPFVYDSTGKRIDQTGFLKSLLEKIGIPFESRDELVRIHAYTAPTKNPID